MKKQITNNGYMYKFDTGMVLSVIGGDGFYGDGKTSFEIGVWYEDEETRSPIMSRGWVSAKQVKRYKKLLKSLS